MTKYVDGSTPARLQMLGRAGVNAGVKTRLRGWLECGNSLLRASAGTAAVEFGLAAPILMGLLVPIADLGIAFSRQIQVQQAAQAGAQYAALHPWHSNSPTEIANAVTAAGTLPIAATPVPRQICACQDGSAIAEATCGTTCSNSEIAGSYVLVNAQLPYSPPLPYSVLGSSVMLAAEATVRIH